MLDNKERNETRKATTDKPVSRSTSENRDGQESSLQSTRNDDTER